MSAMSSSCRARAEHQEWCRWFFCAMSWSHSTLGKPLISTLERPIFHTIFHTTAACKRLQMCRVVHALLLLASVSRDPAAIPVGCHQVLSCCSVVKPQMRAKRAREFRTTTFTVCVDAIRRCARELFWRCWWCSCVYSHAKSFWIHHAMYLYSRYDHSARSHKRVVPPVDCVPNSTFRR